VIASGTGECRRMYYWSKRQSNFEDAGWALTGGTAKNGISASEPGHLGVGQNDGDATKNYFPIITKRLLWKVSPVMNVLTFSVDGGNQV
jgi:hypothetical protein